MLSRVQSIANGVSGLTLTLAPPPVVEVKPKEVESSGLHQHMVVWNAKDQQRMRKFATIISAQSIVVWVTGAVSQAVARPVVVEQRREADPL